MHEFTRFESFDDRARSAGTRVALALVSATLVGCTMGPDYVAPPAPTVTSFTSEPTPRVSASADVLGGDAQHFDVRDIPAEWWRLFECDELDELVRRALEDSPRLAQARAKLAQADETLAGRRGATKSPQVGISGSANWLGVDSDAFDSGGLGSNVGDNFPLSIGIASLNVSYGLDLFGKHRRELEGLSAAMDFERFELEAVRLILAGNVVTTAIREAALREQLERTQAMVALDERRLDILERLEELGGVPRLDVIAQRGQLAGTRAMVPRLERQLEQTRHRMAVYLGQPPAAVQLPEFRMEELRLPTELPLSLPSELVRQRPDILAAEALLHRASAGIGVATADMYPDVTISATGGAAIVSDLLSSGAWFALFGASVSQSLFDGGASSARKRAAIAAFEQAGAVYREVVLEGFLEVADTLVALESDARRLRERADGARFARTAYEIASQRYTVGGISLLTLLDVERQAIAATLDEATARSDRHTDTAMLFLALGGGWWNAVE